ncbi:MAG: NUDIX hydrolase [Candidatus Azambacteria bacterium]|nr:NUDIX hydrolase [Candidatus Azambacteria bacterium]
MINCAFENERKSSLRHVTVGAITINDKNQILLVKRAAHVWNGNKYTIPGGFLDRNESTKEGALRELREETGLTGKISFLFRVNDNPNRPKEDRQNVDFIYVVEITGGDIKTSQETASIDWFSVENLPSDEEFAFDHRDSIVRYFEYLKEPFSLPIIG